MAMEAPLTPYWEQPSHPSIHKVIFASKDEFLTKSISRIDLPPYALYAKMVFPPCSKAEKATYATVQMTADQHLNLNSDLVYINHSCDPSLIFDTSSLSIIAGAKGLKEGEELTFFYPSTEWDMAQGFDCFCGTTNCRGSISGAKNMSAEQLEGMWLNAHIRELLEERNGDSEEIESGGPGAWSEHGKAGGGGDIVNPLLLVSRNGTVEAGAVTGKEGAEGGVIKDATEAALRASLEQARKMVEAAQKALHTYKSIHGFSGPNKRKDGKGASVRENGVGSRELSGEMGGDTRQGVTSRELSGEMGGDTLVDV